MNIPLTAGTRVKILRHKAYKNRSLVGLMGTVRTGCYMGNVGVDVDGLRNDNSTYGFFYFSPSELQVIDEPENQNENIFMEENTMSKITNYLNGVKIQFAGDQTPSRYVYANFIAGLAVGDVCVVKYPGDNRGGMGVATVVEVLDGNDYETDREIVVRVDMCEYNDRVATRAKAAELKAKMQERAKKLQDIIIYQTLAKDDPEMMALLSEYQSLPSV